MEATAGNLGYLLLGSLAWGQGRRKNCELVQVKDGRAKARGSRLAWGQQTQGVEAGRAKAIGCGLAWGLWDYCSGITPAWG